MDKLLASQVSVIYFLTDVFCFFISRMAQKNWKKVIFQIRQALESRGRHSVYISSCVLRM